MNSVTLLLPIPPSTNSLFVQRGQWRTKTTPYTGWLNTAGWDIKLQVPPFEGTLVPGIVAVSIEAPLHRRRDIDNALKAILDLLVKQRIIADDNLIDDLRIRRVGFGEKVSVHISTEIPPA